MSDPCSVCGRRLRSVLVPRFLSPAASWTPIAGPLAAHCFPALPASALRKAPLLPTESSASALRKAPFLPTESSASALRKAPFLPTEAPPLPYGSSVSAYGKLRLCPTEKLRFCLRKAPYLPTESSASALRKAPFLPTESSASALRKAPFLPTESSASALRKAPFLPTESSASAYEELHFSFSLCITSCNKLSFPQLNPPVFIVTEGSDQSSWIQRRLVVCKTDIRQQRSYGSPGGEYVEHRTSCAGVSAQVSELTTQVQLLRSPAAPPTPPSFSIPGNHSPQHEPRLPAPEMYAGDPNLCRAFLTKCSLFFSLQPLTFATEVSRVALVLTLLSGRAALWGTAVWENRHPCCSSFHSLSQEMRRVFDRALVGREAARMLAELFHPVQDPGRV